MTLPAPDRPATYVPTDDLSDLSYRTRLNPTRPAPKKRPSTGFPVVPACAWLPWTAATRSRGASTTSALRVGVEVEVLRQRAPGRPDRLRAARVPALPATHREPARSRESPAAPQVRIRNERSGRRVTRAASPDADPAVPVFGLRREPERRQNHAL